jgi:hypothetical protein
MKIITNFASSWDREILVVLSAEFPLAFIANLRKFVQSLTLLEANKHATNQNELTAPPPTKYSHSSIFRWMCTRRLTGA